MDTSLLKKNDMRCIRSCFLFKDVEESGVAAVLSDGLCGLSEFKKGTVIFDTDRYRKSLGFVLSGGIRVSKRMSADKRYVMNMLTAGEVFGVAAIFTDEPGYVTELTAASDCRIIFFPEELMKKAMGGNFTIAENYIRFLSGRIHFLNGRIQNLISVSADQAVARYLRENACREGGRIFVRLKCSYSALAEMLNIGRASLYRALDYMESAGFIKKTGKDIEILDISAINGI